MKNKLRKVLSKEIPISVLKKTLALLLTFLMVVTSGDFSGLYAKAETSESGSADGFITLSGRDPKNTNNNLSVNIQNPIHDRQYSAYDILGEAWNYGITADTLNSSGDSETNFAVKYVEGFPNQSGVTNKAYYSDACVSYMGQIAKNVNKIRIKGPGNRKFTHTVYTADDPNKFENADSTNLIIQSKSLDEIKNYIDSLRNGVKHFESKDSISTSQDDLPVGRSDQGYTLDLTNAADGTYFFNLDTYSVIRDAFANNGRLTIKKNKGQSLVFNSDRDGEKDPININKYIVEQDGKTVDSVQLANPSEDGDKIHVNDAMDIAGSIICNFPNATKVHLEDFAGIVLAPNAEVTYAGVGGGWLVAKKVISGAEWHFTNTKLTTSPATVALQAKKTINGNPIVDIGDKTPTFSFKLQKQVKNGDTIGYEDVLDANNNTIGDVQNKGDTITFPEIKFTVKEEGVHINKITENFRKKSEKCSKKIR